MKLVTFVKFCRPVPAHIVVLAMLALSVPLALAPAVWASQTVPNKPAPAPPKAMAERLAEMEKEIEKQRSALGIPGVALVIVQGDKIIYLKGLGLRDVAGNKPVTPDTLFAIGSSTKAFTAASVLMSRDDGKLSLDDSPKKVLPYFKLQDPEADKNITIRDLMCHDSGLPRTDLAWISGALTREEGIRLLADVKPTAPFRKAFQYQNLMFAAAGEIASHAQKMPYETLIETRLLQPLGMTNSNLRVKIMQKSKDFATGYAANPAHPGSQPLPLRSIDAIGPAGAVNSSARDMSQWLRFLLAGGVTPGGKRLLTEASFAEMVKPQTVIVHKVVSYGLGWFVRQWHGLTVIEHGGNIDGFNAEVAFLPEKDLGFVLLTNVTSSPLAQSSLDIVWSSLIDMPSDAPGTVVTAPDTGPAVPPKEEAGVYLLSGARMTVAFAADKLTMTVPGQPAYPLERLSGRRYKLAAPAPDGFFITFRPVKDKPTETEASLEQPNGTFTLKKEVAEAASSFVSPLSVDDLLAKMILASGGEVTLRRHKTAFIRSRVVLENQGLVAEAASVMQYPNHREQKTRFIALGTKVVGTTRNYFDGMSGRFESDFTSGSEYAGGALYDTTVQSFLQPLLDARKIFPKLEIIEKKAVGGEEVLVLRKTPALGSPITEYVSLKSFLIVRRDTTNGADAPGASPAEVHTEILSDYRAVDGEMIPFKTMTRSAALGMQVETIVEAKFNVPTSKNAFLPGKETARPGTK